MEKAAITTKSPEQISAEFDTVFKNLFPTWGGTPTLDQRMKPYRKEILKLRRRGLSWHQIAAGMSQPPLNEKVSSKTLRSLFGEAEAKPAGTNSEPPRG
jgi:hypothetical protein